MQDNGSEYFNALLFVQRHNAVYLFKTYSILCIKLQWYHSVKAYNTYTGIWVYRLLSSHCEVSIVTITLFRDRTLSARDKFVKLLGFNTSLSAYIFGLLITILAINLSGVNGTV